MKEGITGRFGPQLLTDCRLTGADKVVHCTDDRTLVLIFSPIFFIRCVVHILLGRCQSKFWSSHKRSFDP